MNKCKNCGNDITPRNHTGGPEKIYCCDACGKAYRSRRFYHSESGQRYYRELRKSSEFQIKRKARRDVRTAIANGTLKKPDKCEMCGLNHRQIEAHHNDYSKPLEVVWLCSSCHKII